MKTLLIRAEADTISANGTNSGTGCVRDVFSTCPSDMASKRLGFPTAVLVLA